VNFFGHAAAARHVDDDPAFLLGAMAPDLLPMCGAIAAEPTCAKVRAGQAHHVVADARFHGTQAFTTLTAWAARTLIEAGVSRGPARGAAHVAIELFLDGVLAEDGAACAAYRRSLAEADAAQSPFLWADDSSRGRWRALVVRLRAGTVPDDYREADFVADRVIGVLGRRPRLALAPPEAMKLRAFLPQLKRRVSLEADALGAGLVTAPAVSRGAVLLSGG